MTTFAGSRCLMIFTKPARAGRVKTRLVGELTPVQTAELHAAFLTDLFERMRSGTFEIVLSWALDEGDEIPAFRGHDRNLRQRGNDLGARLWSAFDELAERYESLVAVGSDHPELALETVETAFEKLEAGTHDVVLGPSADGGYYLIGTGRSRLQRSLFENIEWSTERVLEQTELAVATAGLSVDYLPLGYDIDRPADLAAFVARLQDGARGTCPRTEKLLAAWGMHS